MQINTEACDYYQLKNNVAESRLNNGNGCQHLAEYIDCFRVVKNLFTGSEGNDGY